MTKQPSLEDWFSQILDLVSQKFLDLVVDTKLHFSSSGAIEKLRLYLKDESYVDIWLSTSGKYSFHWEQRHVRRVIHRHDNAPHPAWKKVATFPKHFHNGSELNVQESCIPDNPVKAANYFLSFIRDTLKHLG